VFADIGINVNRVTVNLDPQIPQYNTSIGTDPHFALGARRAVSTNNDLGVRAEVDEIQNHMLIGFRAIDWRYRFDDDAFAVGAFVGVNRYQLATPAYSEYAGLGAEWRNFLPWFPKWDLGLEYRHAQNIARDHVLPTDPSGSRPDSFYKIDSVVLFISRHF
jgi:hypothetical protein